MIFQAEIQTLVREDSGQHLFIPLVLSSCFLPPTYFQVSQWFHLFLSLSFLFSREKS